MSTNLAPAEATTITHPPDMSRSPTFTSQTTNDEYARTLTVNSINDKGSPSANGHNDLPAESTLGVAEKQLEAEGKVATHDSTKPNALASLPRGRKNILTFAFCLAMVSLWCIECGKSPEWVDRLGFFLFFRHSSLTSSTLPPFGHY